MFRHVERVIRRLKSGVDFTKKYLDQIQRMTSSNPAVFEERKSIMHLHWDCSAYLREREAPLERLDNFPGKSAGVDDIFW